MWVCMSIQAHKQAQRIWALKQRQMEDILEIKMAAQYVRIVRLSFHFANEDV